MRRYHTLARLRHPHAVEVFEFGRSEHGPYYTYGVTLWMESLLESSAFGGVAIVGACELETLGTRWFNNAADQVRMVFHATRGEAQLAARYRERIELFAMQGGTTWQLQLVAAPVALSLDVRTGDAIAARRNADRMAHPLPSYAGRTDEFRIYDRALSPVEIADSFDAGPNPE